MPAGGAHDAAFQVTLAVLMASQVCAAVSFSIAAFEPNIARLYRHEAAASLTPDTL